jgi:hypothetical protein
MHVAAQSAKMDDETFNRVVQKIINKIFLSRWERYLRDGWKKDAAMMASMPDPLPGGKLTHIRSLTPTQYELMQLIKPDGMTDAHLNTDFMKYLESREEFGHLKKCKLNAVDPKELGYKEPKK